MTTAVQTPIRAQTVPALSREHAEFLAVYDEHAPMVWRALRRLGVQQESLDDAMQDVFVVVHRQLPTFEHRSSLRTWVFGIVLRVAGNYRRACRRKNLNPEAGVDADTICDPNVRDPAQAAEKAEAFRLLTAFLARLDDDRRTILCMVELEDMSVPEAAALLKINTNTAYTRLRAARQEFQRIVDAYEARTGHQPAGDEHR